MGIFDKENIKTTVIRKDIKRCEERLERLEEACSRLANVQSQELIVKDDLLDECRRQLADYRSQLCDLTAKPCGRRAASPPANCFDSLLNEFEIVPSTCSSNVPSLSYVSLVPSTSNEKPLKNNLNKSDDDDVFVVKSKGITKRRKSKEKCDEEMNVKVGNNSSKLPKNHKIRLAGSRFKRALLYTLPLPLCLILLLIGLSLFDPDLDCKSNNWLWHWGFRLDYVNGPPPT